MNPRKNRRRKARATRKLARRRAKQAYDAIDVTPWNGESYSSILYFATSPDVHTRALAW